jgi:hypothetical protein
LNNYSNFRNTVAQHENSANIGRGLNDITTKVQNDWNGGAVDPSKLRDKLTDLLRILDPQAQPVPRVMTRQAYDA